MPCCSPTPGSATAAGYVLWAVLLGGVDAMEEYFPRLARDWGVPDAVNPLAVLGVPLAGAAGLAPRWPGSASSCPLVVFAAYAGGGLPLATGAVLLLAAALPRLTRTPRTRR
jgi:hypothetical protein